MASLKPLPDGTGWRVRWRSGGKQRERRFTRANGQTEHDAKVFAASVQADMARGTYIDPTLGSTPLDTLAESWLTGKRRLEGSTRERYGYAIKAITDHFGPVAVANVRHSHVEDWVAAQITDGLAPATIRKNFGVLSQMMGRAARDGLRNGNPCDGVETPPVSREEMLWLTPAEVERVAAYAGHHGPLIRFLAYTGLRWGEATGLRVADVDALRGRVRVTGRVKTASSEREVPLEPVVRREVLERVEGRPPDALVFTTRQGKQVQGTHFRNRVWRPALKAAGLSTSVRPHDLRHSCATWLIESGVDVLRVSKWLGHASPTTTLNVYAHLFPDDLDEVAAKLSTMRDREDTGPASLGKVREL